MRSLLMFGFMLVAVLSVLSGCAGPSQVRLTGSPDIPGAEGVVTTSTSNDGNTKLALFEGAPPGPGQASGFRLVAFRVGAAGFIRFLERLGDLQLKDHRDQSVTVDSVIDHAKAYSVYFSDPYGHRFEVTTYEYEASRVALMSIRA